MKNKKLEKILKLNKKQSKNGIIFISEIMCTKNMYFKSFQLRFFPFNKK